MRQRSTCARVMLAAAIVAVAACGPTQPTVADKAGGVPEPVTLRLGTGEANGNPMAPVLQRFADAVAERTGGRLKIEVAWLANDGATDYEAAIIDKVASGALDLGVTGTRGWDNRVSAVRSLQAPFLIDSHPLLDRVLESDVSNEILASLAPAGFKGLGLFPGQLRRFIGLEHPLVAEGDFAGIGVRVPTSVVADALVRSLGAEPRHLVGEALQKAIDAGEVRALETSVGNAAPFALRSTMTSNLVLYPLVGVFFADAERFAGWPPETQAALVGAAEDAAALATSSDLESSDIAAFCLTGGRFAAASDAELDGIRASADTVYQTLRTDAATAALIDRIDQLKAEVGAPADVPSCGGASPAPPTAPSAGASASGG